jgi:hypothetical protein
MTPTRRRVRMSEYTILVNTVGAVVGAEFMLLYFIYIKQLLNAIKWRTDSPYNYNSFIFQYSLIISIYICILSFSTYQ